MTNQTTAEKYMEAANMVKKTFWCGRLRNVEELGSTMSDCGLKLNEEVHRVRGE